MEWLIVDTPPRTQEAEPIAAHADLVLVPCRPGIADLESILDTIDQVEGTPAWVVLNGVSSLREAKVAEEALEDLGVRVAPVRWSELIGMRRFMVDGLTPIEEAPSSKAAQQVWALYDWVCAQVDHR